MRRWSLLPLGGMLLFCLMPKCFNQDITILSKSEIQRCSSTDGLEDLDCTAKLILEIAVPSGTKGNSNKIEVPVDKAQNISTGRMQLFKDTHKIKIEKSSVDAIFKLSYIQDFNFQPVEVAGPLYTCNDWRDDQMGACPRLVDKNNRIREETKGICCRCGKKFRLQNCLRRPRSSHCMRYHALWYRSFAVHDRVLEFFIKITVSKGEKVLSTLYLGPQHTNGVTPDKFLKASLQGDYISYEGIPNMENYYLSVPINKNNKLHHDYNLWMLIERTRYTTGFECNKIGLSPLGFRSQAGFCNSPLGTCLGNQLVHFYQWDQLAIRRNQIPQYVIARRFERVNKAWASPQDGCFSLGVTAELTSNILLEVKADDIRYIVNTSPGYITTFNISSIEALTQRAKAMVSTKNSGDLVASYYLNVRCAEGINSLVDKSLSIKPHATVSTTFYITVNDDKAADYQCTGDHKMSKIKN